MSIKLNKLQKTLSVAIAVALISSSLIVYSKYSVRFSFEKRVPENVKEEANNVREEEPIEKTGDGVYDITIKSVSTSGMDTIISLSLKNLNVKPYITDLGMERCVYTDSNGKEYKGKILAGYSFKKAIVPEETGDVRLITSQVDVSLNEDDEVSCEPEQRVIGYNKLQNRTKCVFNDSGACSCRDLGDLKIKECEFRITENGKQASNGWGKYPSMVNMLVKK